MIHPGACPQEPPRQARPLWDRCGDARPGPSPRTAQRLCDLTAIATAAAFAVPARELVAVTRRQRGVADRTTAAHACRLIEDRRDDPVIDRVLNSLEGACAALRRRLSAEVRP
jgi:hypothetical protein